MSSIVRSDTSPLILHAENLMMRSTSTAPFCRTILLALALAFVFLSEAFADNSSETKPNFVFVLVDDMGFGDLGCYGNVETSTPNIDRLAAEGTLFTQFYVASPICSPSRVALTTGQYPARHLINSYLESREGNRERGMVDFLDSQVPTIARSFQQAGYATAHIGKWHMGGGRDVDDAPLPSEYGFDTSLCSFEGLGDRLLPPGRLSQQSAALGQGNVEFVEKHEMTGRYVDRAIEFIDEQNRRPFYVHLWLNDVHDGHVPSADDLALQEQFFDRPFDQRFYAVLNAMDRELGRLFDHIDQAGLAESTFIVIASDNGPTAWPSYDRAGGNAPGSTGGFRGRKWSLYEGGIRMPLIVRRPGTVPAGITNEATVISAVDFFPTFCALAGLTTPDVAFDGVDMSSAFVGDLPMRTQPLYWEYGRDVNYLQPSRPIDQSPNLAIREGRWKLLINDDGSEMQLYDFDQSTSEFENVAGLNLEVASRLADQVLAWRESLPSLSSDPTASGTEVASATTITTTFLDDADDAPAEPSLVTRFAADVDPSAPLPEYPRPQLVRENWLNLNGYWQYAITPKDVDEPGETDGRIVVPYCIESTLSGVRRRVSVDERLWYGRTFTIPEGWPRERLLLHFGAVDWESTIWVDGELVGEHRGGYDPFTCDITDALGDDWSGEHAIIVSVWDPTDQGVQPRGKQVETPEGIWYTPVTGIWQTVWLEPVGQVSVESMDFVTDIDEGTLQIELHTTADLPPGEGLHFDIRALDGEEVVSTSRVEDLPTSSTHQVTVEIPSPKLWSPSSPFLYDLEVIVTDADGNELDRLTSYFGMREIDMRDDGHGVPRMFLNGEAVFQYGPLDQGWWPDGLYTAPTDEALRYDIEITRQLGFNMARKHVKVEPARWYYWADRLGLLVWQDMPSGMGQGRNQHVGVNQPNDAEFTAEEKEQFRMELQAMIDAFHNHPCIVVWVPFNEGWGQHDTNAVLAWTQEYDPTRLVGGPSGWQDRGFGDLKDMHSYPGPWMFPAMDDRISVLGEFGGLGLPLDGHTWLGRNNWGYRSYESIDDLNDAYAALLVQIPSLIADGLSAAVYTQTTDVEIEVNGFMTYDRAIIKFDEERVQLLHADLYGPPPTKAVLVATSEQEAQSWQFTTTSPVEGWESSEFDDSGWQSGEGGFGTRDTPGTVVRTEWNNDDIWIRRSFEVNEPITCQLALRIHHDEDCEVYLNGVQVASLSGYTTGYVDIPLSATTAEALQTGENVVAIHCHQTGGGQYIDAGFMTLTRPTAE